MSWTQHAVSTFVNQKPTIMFCNGWQHLKPVVRIMVNCISNVGSVTQDFFFYQNNAKMAFDDTQWAASATRTSRSDMLHIKLCFKWITNECQAALFIVLRALILSSNFLPSFETNGMCWPQKDERKAQNDSDDIKRKVKWCNMAMERATQNPCHKTICSINEEQSTPWWEDDQ